MGDSARRVEAEPSYRRAQGALEALFLFMVGLYLMYCFKSMAMFALSIPDAFFTNLKLLMGVVAAARLALSRREGPELWAGLLLAALYFESYFTMGYSRLPFFAIMVVGLWGIPYQRILKVYCAFIGAALIATVVAGLTGAIPSLVYVREDIRSSWGTAYPTDFSTIVLFVTMTVWVAWPNLPDWAMLGFGLVPVLLAHTVTLSRTSLICGALFEALVCCHWLESWLLRRRKRLGKQLSRHVDRLLTLALPLSTAISYLLVFLYAKRPDALARVDEMLSGRLALELDAVRTYGLSPFGMKISFHGGLGGSVFPRDTYNFVDCSYLQYLLRYGWVTFLGACAGWVWMTRRALRGNNRRMAMVMAVIAIHSILEHHLADGFHNIFLMMPLAALRVRDTSPSTAAASTSPSSLKAERRGRGAAFAIVLALLLALMGAFLPAVMSRLRTVFAAQGWQGGGANAVPVLCTTLALIAAAGLSAWGLYRLLCAAFTRKSVQAVAVAALAVGLALGLGLTLRGNALIADATRTKADAVEADAAALSLLTDRPLYVDTLPEVYRERYPNVVRSVLGGEDLARLKDATVLTAAEPEYHVFFLKGFSYARISEGSAIYTSDPQAIEALRAGGFAVDGFYTATRRLDLTGAAEKNGLTLDADGLHLIGLKHSLTKGLSADLYNGSYVVAFDLSLPQGDAAKSSEVCELSIQRKDQEVLASVVVTDDDFDAEGKATIAVPLALEIDTADVRFQAVARKKRQVCVREIRYTKTAG